MRQRIQKLALAAINDNVETHTIVSNIIKYAESKIIKRKFDKDEYEEYYQQLFDIIKIKE